MNRPSRKSPRTGRREGLENRHSGQGGPSQSSATRGPSIPADWRDRLPDPATYYALHVAKLSRPNGTGWAQGICPFHEDRNASLSVHVTNPAGGWKCFASCGGGDMASFHQRVTGKPFREAVADLLRWRP